LGGGIASPGLDAPIFDRLETLGHSRIGITLDLYSHAVANLQDEAATKLDSALGAAVGCAVATGQGDPSRKLRTRQGLKNADSIRFCADGEMAERLNAAVLKTAGPSRGSWVRIPLSPRLTSLVSRLLE
jgi:hypothetical protein